MNFLRLKDPILSVLFEDEDIIAIDKPYGFNAHTNDSKIAHSEFIEDGLIEIYEKNRGQKLHIIHRLDQTTTGVMIFGKSAEAAKKYADFFFRRQVKKTYWFVTKSKSLKASYLIDDVIIHKAKELEAKTELRLQEKAHGFELWEALPFTGRNHQIRIHAKSAGISILGDAQYDGASFPMLCLHNHKIEFPNGISILSEPPIYFRDLALLSDSLLCRNYFEVDRRNRLFSLIQKPEQCLRLLQAKNKSGELEYSLDQLGKVLFLNWSKENWNKADEEKFLTLAKSLNKSILVRKLDKTQVTLSPSKSIEPLTTWTAFENQTQIELRSDAGANLGLTPHLRLQRNWVQENSQGLSVLNLFAGTGNYGLAAALGKASQLTMVETNKNALNYARKNFELNSLKPENFKFLCRDSIHFLEQSQTKNVKFDLILCDAPSFLKQDKKTFILKDNLEDLIRKCLSCLNPKGQLLFSTTIQSLYIRDVRQAFLNVQKNLKLAGMELNSVLPALDFELPDERALLKSFILRLT